MMTEPPCCLDDFEVYARESLSRARYAYFASFADEGVTLRRNRSAFRRIVIRPRLLHESVEKCQLGRTALGSELKIPIGISPTAGQKFAHPDGEIGTAKAITLAGGVMVLSGFSSTRLEDVAEAAGPTTANLWLNVYLWKRREVMWELVKRAERANFKAVVVSCDTAGWGVRRGYNQAELWDSTRDIRLEHFHGKVEHVTDVRHEFGTADPAATWADFQELCNGTSLPVVAKGITTGFDALAAVNHGAKAVLVSNHGGRYLDSLPATIDVLPEVVKALEGTDAEVYMDGGIRTGNDLFKSLALGARLGFVGRPACFGLAYKGQEGVSAMLNCLSTELKLTMLSAGCPDVRVLDSNFVGPEGPAKL